MHGHLEMICLWFKSPICVRQGCRFDYFCSSYGHLTQTCITDDVVHSIWSIHMHYSFSFSLCPCLAVCLPLFLALFFYKERNIKMKNNSKWMVLMMQKEKQLHTHKFVILPYFFLNFFAFLYYFLFNFNLLPFLHWIRYFIGVWEFFYHLVTTFLKSYC